MREGPLGQKDAGRRGTKSDETGSNERKKGEKKRGSRSRERGKPVMCVARKRWPGGRSEEGWEEDQ